MTKWHLGAWHVAKHRKYYKGGRWCLPPSPNHSESCESMFAHGSSVHQKCSNYALTNLLFGLCKSVWTIDLLNTRPNPHSKAPDTPLPPKCYKPRSIPQLLILSLFSFWIRNWVYQGAWGCIIYIFKNNMCIQVYGSHIQVANIRI
jgi:hypothetical protein